MAINDLTVKLFADGADLTGMLKLAALPHISGFTTNPTLMRKANIVDYQQFASEVIKRIPDRPISFEVFADEFDQMERQARLINSWGPNVYVKIPITNTKGASASGLIEKLSNEGVKLNITAMMTLDHVRTVGAAVKKGAPSIVSVFAGRIADTGRDPIPMMVESLHILADSPAAELLWASPRELLNIVQASQIGCHIITATSDILNKLALLDKNLDDYSLDTVKMFYEDAHAAGYSL